MFVGELDWTASQDGPGDKDGPEDLGEVVDEVEERLQHRVEGVGPRQMAVVEQREEDELGVREQLHFAHYSFAGTPKQPYEEGGLKCLLFKLLQVAMV